MRFGFTGVVGARERFPKFSFSEIIARLRRDGGNDTEESRHRHSYVWTARVREDVEVKTNPNRETSQPQSSLLKSCGPKPHEAGDVSTIVCSELT